MKRAAVVVLMLTASTPALARPPASSDLRDYAFGSCLIAQTSSDYLRNQGYLIGQMQINRIDTAEFFRWKPIGEAVVAQLKREPVLEVRTDGPVADPTDPAPVAQCLHILDTPRVRVAIAAVEARWRRKR